MDIRPNEIKCTTTQATPTKNAGHYKQKVAGLPLVAGRLSIGFPPKNTLHLRRAIYSSPRWGRGPFGTAVGRHAPHVLIPQAHPPRLRSKVGLGVERRRLRAAEDGRVGATPVAPSHVVEDNGRRAGNVPLHVVEGPARCSVARARGRGAVPRGAVANCRTVHRGVSAGPEKQHAASPAANCGP